jgi:N-hydroxyarylamine O-acetyltransferase
MIDRDPVLAAGLVERVLDKLDLSDRPSGDLAGLNTVYAAWSGGVPFDNVQKRIWFAGDRRRPPTGGVPSEFWENWLAHGTGGTCWPTAGALYALLRALDFPVRRVAGIMIAGDAPASTNHGSCIVKLCGTDYLVDGSMSAFEALPLVPGEATAAGRGMHAVNARASETGFDVHWYAGFQRDAPIVFRTEPGNDPVDHDFFLAGYERSTARGIFNAALLICRRHTDRIDTLGRRKRITVTPDGPSTVTGIGRSERKRILVEEMGLSEAIVDALPADEVVALGQP